MPDDTVTTPADTEVTPVAVPPAPPRPLDAISADVSGAQVRHAAAVSELQTSSTLLKTLAAEYRAAIGWFEKECQAVESDVASAVDGAESWLAKLASKL